MYKRQGLDSAVRLHKVVDKLLGKLQILLVTSGLVQAQAGGDHAAIDVVPLVGLAAAHLSLIHILTKNGIQQG